MRQLLILTALFGLLPAVSGQINFVKNGDFSQIDSKNLPKLWTVTHKSFHYAKVADFTWKGVKRMAKAFQCQPGGASGFSRPYPLAILEQTITIPSGIPLEVSADIIHSRARAVTNADRGLVKVYLGGQLIESCPTGKRTLIGPDAMCEQIAARVIMKTGGPTKLKITFERNYYATDVIVLLDNVRIAPTPDPVFAFRGDRKIGKPFSCQTMGLPSAGYIIFFSTALNNIPGGIPISGVFGKFELTWKRIFTFQSGALDSTGKDTKTGSFPNEPALVGIPLFFQPMQFTKSSRISLGFTHRFSFYVK